jgi:transformation/transcription domain-associated protein
MLADLVHHVRDKLSVPQLCRVVHIYACCLHEPAFTFGIQTMCAKLLLNLIETICTKTEKTESPKFLMTILESCIDKLVAVEAIHGRLREVHTRSKKEKEEKGKEKKRRKRGRRAIEGREREKTTEGRPRRFRNGC